MMVPAFILAVALCPDCEFKAVGTTLMSEHECAELQVEYANAYPQREFDCAPVPGRSVEVIEGERPADKPL